LANSVDKSHTDYLNLSARHISVFPRFCTVSRFIRRSLHPADGVGRSVYFFAMNRESCPRGGRGRSNFSVVASIANTNDGSLWFVNIHKFSYLIIGAIGGSGLCSSPHIARVAASSEAIEPPAVFRDHAHASPTRLCSTISAAISRESSGRISTRGEATPSASVAVILSMRSAAAEVIIRVLIFGISWPSASSWSTRVDEGPIGSTHGAEESNFLTSSSRRGAAQFVPGRRSTTSIIGISSNTPA